MTVDYICREVAKLKRKYGEDDPFKLVKAMGIFVLFEPMGHRIEDCNGFFLAQSRKKAITINSDLPEPLQRIICIHEVGHAVLHAKQSGVCAFHDFSLFEGTSRAEYESNVFSADYLLDDGVVLDMLNEYCFFFAAAARLRVPAELLDFKFRILKLKGYKLDAPFVSDSCFLKNVQVPDEDNEC